MSVNPLINKYYEFLIKLYRNVNNENIVWIKASKAEFYTADIKDKFRLKLSKSVANLSSNYILRMFDDNGVKIFEISTEKNGQDVVDVDGTKHKVSDILEEMYEWAMAFSGDIVKKIDIAKNLLDSLERSSF